DARHGGAWAIVLSGASSEETPSEDQQALQPRLYSSGILATMLELSRKEYAAAAAGAESLGAHRLAQWARKQESAAHEQAEGECKNPGYISRLKKLSAWKMEVLG